MKHRFILSLALFLVSFGFVYAQGAHESANIHNFVTKEVLQTSNYTYLLANENDELQWLAVPKMKAAVGESYYYQGGMEMKDFKSSELERVFESVLFLGGVSGTEVIEQSTSKDNQQQTNNKLTQSAEAIPIGELLANKQQYKGKTVTLQGKVVKYNSGIMGVNWVHLQDDNPQNDITITTDDTVALGDIVVFKGKVTLDKDLGAGYFYDIIIEEAVLIK